MKNDELERLKMIHTYNNNTNMDTDILGADNIDHSKSNDDVTVGIDRDDPLLVWSMLHKPASSISMDHV